jgi:hypothetical protein
MDTIQNIIFAIVGIIYLIYSALKESKKGKTGTPGAGETPVLPKEDIPSLEDLLRGLGRKDGAGKGNPPGSKGNAPGGAKGPARRVPGPVRSPSATPLPSAPSPQTPSTPEPFTTAQKHVFERRPSYEQLEQSDVSYEQAPSADELAPSLERVPRYTNEAAEVDYEDPKRAAYAGLDTVRPRLETVEQEKKKVNPYARLLRNSQAAREAFILTEIFRRKY